jgi:two-component system, LytTR family, response regulator
MPNVGGVSKMNTIQTLLVDDHEDSLEILQFFMESIPGIQIIGTCRNGDELLDDVMRMKPDLVLTDINMPKKNGMNAIQECLTFDPHLKFIFITGYDEYAIEAFRINAVDYIVKPVEKGRLYQAIERAKKVISLEQSQSNPIPTKPSVKKLQIRDRSCTRYIPLDDIYFFEKIGKKSFIYTKHEIYETTEPLGNLVKRLDETFFQTHRSYIIHLDKISLITPQFETFTAFFHDYDKQASISKLKINEVRERMGRI